MNTEVVENMLQVLAQQQPTIRRRDRYYRGQQVLRYASNEITGDLARFNTNVCRVAVTSLAERLRLKRIRAAAGGRDVSERAEALWLRSNMDQLLQSALADALAVGASYLIVWPNLDGIPTVMVESAEQVVTSRDAITGSVTGAVKHWFEHDHHGVVLDEHVMYYTADEITHYVRGPRHDLVKKDSVPNALGAPVVVPLINLDRVTDVAGYSVIDDLAPLVDALSKLLSDMLVVSESLASPKRWASGVDLEEKDDDGFSADETFDDEPDDPLENQATSPFADGDMWTVENEHAKFGQLPGSDLAGYRSAIDLIIQQISTVAALPPHMLGVTSANPTSADAIRAAEASLTARAEARARVFGLPIEEAVSLLVAADMGVTPGQVDVRVEWRSPATRSVAQEADAVTKLFSLGLLSREEARSMMGLDSL